jgi:hypothetical protein
MFVVRDIMHCKPGKVGEIVRRFKEFLPLFSGDPNIRSYRVMTDVVGESYWTVVAETEVKDLNTHMEMQRQSMNDARFQKIMQGYHDFVESGKREIFKIES